MTLFWTGHFFLEGTVICGFTINLKSNDGIVKKNKKKRFWVSSVSQMIVNFKVLYTSSIPKGLVKK